MTLWSYRANEEENGAATVERMVLTGSCLLLQHPCITDCGAWKRSCVSSLFLLWLLTDFTGML